MTIITKENKRLYLSSWGYNAARIMTELAKIVENHGGRVKPLKRAVISNRNIEYAKEKLRDSIEKLIVHQKTEYKEIREKRLEKCKCDLAYLEQIDNSPITVTHTSYIRFVLDGAVYYYQMDDNPFFNSFYSKTPLVNGYYSRRVHSETDIQEWFDDCFLSYNCSFADIKEAANWIFNMLVRAPQSKIHSESERIKVPNTYDGGWHYETVYRQSKMKKLDF